MTKKAIKKMAEMHGYGWYEYEWAKNNIKQAFEVLEEIKSNKIIINIESSRKEWECTIGDHRKLTNYKSYTAQSPLLSEAIFNAVKKYLEAQ